MSQDPPPGAPPAAGDVRSGRVPRRLALAALAAAAAIVACTEALDPTGLDGPLGPLRLALQPVVYAIAGNEPQPVNLARLIARRSPGDQVLADTVQAVSPDSAEWRLGVAIPTGEETQFSVVVEIHLLHRATTGETTVEWSGRTSPIQVAVGREQQVARVEVYRGPPENLAVTAVVIDGDPPASVLEGATVSLAARAEGNADAQVFWSSLTPSIAEVDAAGTVQTLLPGQAVIAATAGPRADTVRFAVLQRVTSLAFGADSLLLESLGAEGTLPILARDARGAAVDGVPVEVTLENGAIADHLGAGRFRSKAVGRTAVRAASPAWPGLAAAAAAVVVRQVPAELVITASRTESSAIGERIPFAAEVRDAAHTAVAGAAIDWSSSAPAVATVGPDGVVVTVAPGATEIVAAHGALSASVPLTVEQRAARVELEPSGLELRGVGATGALTARVVDVAGSSTVDQSVAWASSDPDIASVTQAGAVTATGLGTASITATQGTAVGTATVEVVPAVTTIELAPATLGLAEPGDTGRIVATVRDEGGLIVAEPRLTWSTSDAAVATVDGAGLVTATGDGAATITAAAGEATGTATVRVQSVNLRIESFTVETTPAGSLDNGGSVKLTAIVVNDGADAAGATSVAFRLLSDGDFRVLETETVPLGELGPGARATATFQETNIEGGADWTAKVLIEAAVDPADVVAESDETDNVARSGVLDARPLKGVATTLAVSPRTLAVNTGATGQLGATGTDPYGTVVSAGLTWTSRNPAVATVSGTGQVTGVAVGTTRVVVAHPRGAADSATVTVSSPAPTNVATAVAIDQDSVGLTALGSTSQLGARAVGSNGTVDGVSIGFVSRNTGVASVSATGLVTAVGEGTTWVVGTASGLTPDSAKINVDQVVTQITLSLSGGSTLEVGDTTRITATAKDANGNATGDTVSFHATNPGSGGGIGGNVVPAEEASVPGRAVDADPLGRRRAVDPSLPADRASASMMPAEEDVGLGYNSATAFLEVSTAGLIHAIAAAEGTVYVFAKAGTRVDSASLSVSMPSGFDKVWLGGRDHGSPRAWGVAKNWSGGTGPGNSHRVLIRKGTSYNPQVTSAPPGILKLAVRDGVVLDIRADLTVMGDVDAAGSQPITNAGGAAIIVAPASGNSAVLSGRLPKLRIAAANTQDTVALSGSTVIVDDSVVVSSGKLNGDGATLSAGHFRTTGSGKLKMTKSGARLEVVGDARFEGGVSDTLSAGTIAVGGDFVVGANNAFKASGAHTVSLQSVSSPVGNLVPGTGASLVQATFTSDGSRTFSTAGRSGITFGSVRVSTSDEVTLDGSWSSAGSLRIENGTVTAADDTLSLAGDLAVQAGKLTLTSANVTVGDSLTVQGTGRLVLNRTFGADFAADVDVAGHATFQGAAGAGDLADGTLDVAGNFRTGTSSGQFSPASAFSVNLDGTGQQIVTLGGDAAFQSLTIENVGSTREIRLNSDLTVKGRFVAAGTGTGQSMLTIAANGGEARLLKLARVDVDYVVLDNTTVEIEDSTTTTDIDLDNVTIQNTSASRVQLKLRHPGRTDHVAFDFDNLTFSTVPDTMYVEVDDYDGNDALLPQLTVRSPAAENRAKIKERNKGIVSWVNTNAGIADVFVAASPNPTSPARSANVSGSFAVAWDAMTASVGVIDHYEVEWEYHQSGWVSGGTAQSDGTTTSATINPSALDPSPSATKVRWRVKAANSLSNFGRRSAWQFVNWTP